MAEAAIVQLAEYEQFRRAVRPIDLVHLAKQCLGDEHLESEILRLFDTTLDTYMTRLGRAETDVERLMHLHSIRGAAGGVGAFTVADLARAAEADLLASQPVNEETLADLAVAVEEVRGFIGHMLSGEPA
jgi:hypothetical protein